MWCPVCDHSRATGESTSLRGGEDLASVIVRWLAIASIAVTVAVSVAGNGNLDVLGVIILITLRVAYTTCKPVTCGDARNPDRQYEINETKMRLEASQFEYI